MAARFARDPRPDKALPAALAEMDVQVSARKGKAITAALAGHSFPAPPLATIGKKLDRERSCFARRRLAGPFPYPIFDARDGKVRIDHLIHSPAVRIAAGIGGEDGGKFRAPGLPTARAGRAAGLP